MPRVILILSVLLFSSTLSAQDLRIAMEASYNIFTNSLKAKDATKFKSAVSNASYMKMKNAMTSSKSAFPETFFESTEDYTLNFTTLQFLKAIENGATGNLIYYDNTEENVILLKFTKEAGAWKFSELESYGTQEIANRMKKKDLSFLDEKKFKPNGIIAIVPQEIKSVDYIAMIDIAGEYKVSISLNGIEQESTNGGSKSGLLIGGVKKGKNTIVIKLTPLEGVKGSGLSISVRSFIQENPKEVFLLKSATPSTTITKEFVAP